MTRNKTIIEMAQATIYLIFPEQLINTSSIEHVHKQLFLVIQVNAKMHRIRDRIMKTSTIDKWPTQLTIKSTVRLSEQHNRNALTVTSVYVD